MRQEDFLDMRAKRCVCKQCGTRIEKKVVVYNRYGGMGLGLYCPKCQKIEYGTEPEIFALAQEFVENVEFDYFVEMEDEKRHEELNIAKVCEILAWIYRRTGVLDENGIHKDRVNEWE